MITYLLKPSISKLDHLVRDSSVVIERLRKLHVPPSAHFIRIDVKDSFMTGRHVDFVDSCSRHVDEQWRVCFRELLRFILALQYVESEFCPGLVYKVISGAGMGWHAVAKSATLLFTILWSTRSFPNLLSSMSTAI